MRGTPVSGTRAKISDRIIPAYAGNTLRKTKRTVRARDHPRVCGEHRGMDTRPGIRLGSSPRMRGTHTAKIVCRDVVGIIPAYAGNTGSLFQPAIRLEDHPRVCGEHTYPYTFRNGKQGSSPRMRGTHVAGNATPVDSGIIPAYAGNTCSGYGRALWTRDHPRVCGEHGFQTACSAPLRGSSPRMRGTP